MIDLHCHCLPGIDDGAEDLSESLEMCRMAVADGCEVLLATPHQRHPLWENDHREMLRRLTGEIDRHLAGAPRLLPGAEIRVDSETLAEIDRLPDGELQPLADSRYLLLEFARDGHGPDPVGVIHEVRIAGWRTIIAHPELYPWLWDRPEVINQLLAAGALLQVTAMSVTGEFGRRPQAFCDRLIGDGLAHFVASDAHDVSRRPPGLTRAWRHISERWGEPVARALMCDNPQAVIENRELPVA